MYRFLVFRYDQYYPGGGMEDCFLKSNDPAEVIFYINNSTVSYDFYEIYDTQTDKTYNQIKEFEDGMKDGDLNEKE